jgi:hypothetical protein
MACIDSGTGESIQSVLNDGKDAMLCKGAEFEISQRLDYASDGQSIYTEGRPPGNERAVLKVSSPDLTTVIKETDLTDLDYWESARGNLRLPEQLPRRGTP